GSADQQPAGRSRRLLRRLRGRVAVRGRVRDLEHLLDHGRPARPGARPAADARRAASVASGRHWQVGDLVPIGFGSYGDSRLRIGGIFANTGPLTGYLISNATFTADTRIRNDSVDLVRAPAPAPPALPPAPAGHPRPPLLHPAG